jgi:hypothetical protein
LLKWEDATYSGISTVGDVTIFNDNGSGDWANLSAVATNTGGGTGYTVATSVPSTDFNSGSVFTFGDITGANPLPVILVSFNAAYNDGNVNLNWQTASEINNDYFDIQRSINGSEWVSIGKVEGHGNSYVTHNYTDIDNLEGTIPSGTIYYRLKQVDFNGKYIYSEIRSVNLNNNQLNEVVNIYPNPTEHILNVTWMNSTGDVSILKITDMTGKEIYNQVVDGSGKMQKQVDISAYPEGSYSIQIINGSNTISRMILKN